MRIRTWLYAAAVSVHMHPTRATPGCRVVRTPKPASHAELEIRMRRWLEASEYSAVLFEVDGRSVAYALYATEAEWIHLRQFFVERSVRRRGHGRKAVELLRREVRSANARVTLEVLATNPAGALFWRAVGFHDYALTLESGAARAAH